MLRVASPTPGAVSADQVPARYVAAPAAGTAPAITDLTGGSEVPDTPDLDLGFDVTDDVLVRSVTLHITDNLGPALMAGGALLVLGRAAMLIVRRRRATR